jgi:methionyl-tRNA synthetase
MPGKTKKEKSKKNILITSALPYANGDIHLGHLVETVQTDLFARFQKLLGHRVLYVCADDTHGTPIELTALKRNVPPETLIEEAWKNHVDDYKGFSIDFDIFYSTNSPENKYYAEYIFSQLKDKGLIEEKEVEQFYCEHDKRFLPDRFIVGTCPRCGAEEQYGDVCEQCGATYSPDELGSPMCIICKNTPVQRRSKHLFVQLGKREAFLKEYVNGSDTLQEDMRNFVNGWITEGLREWCISRDGPYFGFPIPGYENKFFYVWLDAPIGYLSSTAKWCSDHGENIDTFWGRDSDTQIVHFIGKDIVYFHALFWPVMLESAEFSLPAKIVVHGFLTVAGEKMSKTRGTFILARDYLSKSKHPQAAELLRFYFASKLSNHAGDIDLNAEEFMAKVNATLVNNFGNLHHRTAIFCQRHFDGKIPDAPWDAAIAADAQRIMADIHDGYQKVDYKTVVEKIHQLAGIGNKFYQDTKPWETIKSDRNRAAQSMVTCMNLIKTIAVALKPIMPHLVADVEKELGISLSWDEGLFSLRDHSLGTTRKLVQPLEMEQIDFLAPGAPAHESEAAASATARKNEIVDMAVFKRCDLRIATVMEAEAVPKSKKLLKLQIDLGEKRRQVVAGIAMHYSPSDIIGKQVVVVANLKPTTLMGIDSEGMILAVAEQESLVLIGPEKKVTPGSKVS